MGFEPTIGAVITDCDLSGRCHSPLGDAPAEHHYKFPSRETVNKLADSFLLFFIFMLSFMSLTLYPHYD